MARLTKKQEQQSIRLINLMHEIIRAKFNNKREEYEEVLEKLRREVIEDEQTRIY